MTIPRRRGRPSQDKVIRPYTLDQKIAVFIDGLPDGDRSKFVNRIVKQGMLLELLIERYYTYVLMKPDGTVFYVGKGTGNRIDHHEGEARKGVQSYKCNVIRNVWKDGGEIIKQKVAFFDKEEDAYQLEILLIRFFGRESLANLTDGGEGVSAIYGPRRDYHIKLPIELVAMFEERAAQHGGIIQYIEKLVRKDLDLPAEEK